MLPAQLSGMVLDARSLVARLQDELAARNALRDSEEDWVFTELDELRSILANVQRGLKTDA